MFAGYYYRNDKEIDNFQWINQQTALLHESITKKSKLLPQKPIVKFHHGLTLQDEFISISQHTPFIIEKIQENLRVSFNVSYNRPSIK